MDLFVARQPIFDKNLNVYGYELLYRSQQTEAYDGIDADRATLDVIHNAFLLIGSHDLAGGKKVFINFTKNILQNGIAYNLPKDVTVIELLETIEVDDDVIAACAKLKKAGYSLALDDYVGDCRSSLVDFVDIIKVDFMACGIEARRQLIEEYSDKNVKLLAEKTETVEDFLEAKQLGYSYFQGYFFSKPVIVSRKDIPTSKIAYLGILQEINSEDLDINGLEGIIKRDTALTFKLLKYVNSSFFGLRKEVESIKHALVLLGQREVKKWASLVVITIIAQDKAVELLVSSLIKAKFCELLAHEEGLRDKEAMSFLVGMFANIDAFIGRPLAEIVDEMSLSDEVKAALKGESNTYRDMLDVVLTYEKGEWDEFLLHAGKFKIDKKRIPELYVESVAWAEETVKVS